MSVEVPEDSTTNNSFLYVEPAPGPTPRPGEITVDGGTPYTYSNKTADGGSP